MAALPGGVNDGQEMWDKVIKKHENWVFTFNGHVLNDGAGYMAERGENGNIVHQMLANYQMRANGGEGYLRIMEFTGDGDTVNISSYSPWTDSYLTTADQQFTMKISELPPPPPPLKGVSAARLSVSDANNVWTIHNSGPQPVTLLSPPNRADFSLAVAQHSLHRDRGVLMASVCQNVRGASYGTVEVSQRNYFSLDDDILQVATSRATHGSEFNVNVATAFFPFDEHWIAGHVLETGDLLEGRGVDAGYISRTAPGQYQIAIEGIDSQNDGMLFAVGGENQDNYLAAAPRADGNGWQLAIRDAKATNFATRQDGRWSFLYVNYDSPGLIGGRVDSGGSLIDAEGNFSINHTPDSGVYRLSINDYTPNDGILILTVAGVENVGGVTAPADNILSYEADGTEFVINTRDRNGSASPLEDCEFVFAFVSYDNELAPLAKIPGDANLDGKVDNLDATVLAANWQTPEGATWETGDFNDDGRVDDVDATLLAANWQCGLEGSKSVPEPSTYAMITIGIICMACGLRGKRR